MSEISGSLDLFIHLVASLNERAQPKVNVVFELLMSFDLCLAKL